jgi:HD-GYP domain-containing protein (c-di-GMP phosphodiesterase class II)
MSNLRGTLIRGVGIALLAAPMALFAVTKYDPSLDPLYMEFGIHFYVVGFTALASAVACAIVMASARTLLNTRLIFLGLAFFVIAGVFSVHGLNTPGYIADQYYVSVGVSSWLSAALGSTLVALSVIGLPKRFEDQIERNGALFFSATAALVFLYIALSLTVDTWLDWVPIQNRNLQFAMGLPSLAIAAFAAYRYYQAYQFARLPSQLAMVATIVILMEVQTIIMWGEVWHLSWWIYHALYGIAFVVLFTGWGIEVKRSGTLKAIADSLSMRDALAQLNRGLEAPILELVDAVEAKDAHTFGHVRRVSGYALAIGRRLELSPADLRLLVLSAEMHDVGKIAVPDSVLAKRGPLTPEEFEIVKQHTHHGYDIAQRVNALRDIADVIKHHHERLDGSGYPDALAGDEIPLLARIIAVADTYDAMTSARPYREPMSHLEAMAELFSLRDVQLDAACVDAFAAEFATQGTKLVHETAAAAAA